MKLCFLHDYTDKNGLPLANNHNKENWAGYISPFYQVSESVADFCLVENYIKNVKSYEDKTIIYLLELAHGELYKIISRIPKSTLTLLQLRRIPILMYFPNEGFSADSHGFWLDHLRAEISAHGLNQNLKFFISGNFKIEMNIKKTDDVWKTRCPVPEKQFDYDWQTRRNLSSFTKTYGFSFFEQQHFFNHISLNNSIHYFYEPRRYKKAKKKLFRSIVETYKKADFLCYNRNSRVHRAVFASELCRHGLNRTNYISFVKKFDFSKKDHPFLEKFLDKGHAELYFNIFSNSLPMILEKETEEDADRIEKINPEYVRNTYYNLVTETEFLDDVLFITEKTWKPICNFQPFMIFGNPHTLKYLKSIGYETFPEMFDESYDDELDPKLRMKKILNEVLKFSSYKKKEKQSRYIQVWDKLLHNRNLCEERYRNNQRGKELKIILDDIYEIINR